jgi:hypothetical protein
MSLAITVVSQTKKTLKISWEPPGACIGYEFLRDGKRVSSTFNGQQSAASFSIPDSEAHTFSVQPLQAGDAGAVTINGPSPAPPDPAPPTPTPPSPGKFGPWAWDAQSATVAKASAAALIANCGAGVTFSASVGYAETDANSKGYAVGSSSPYSVYDAQVYIPAGATPCTPDYDGQLCVVDRINGRETNMEKATYSGGEWSSSEGNSFPVDSVTAPARGCVSAAGTPLSAGLIHPADIQSGVTKTLQYSMDYTKISSAPIVHPGNPQGEPQTGPAGNLPFGAWVRLAASVGSPPSGMDPLSAYVWRCLVANGMVLRDGGSNVDIYGAYLPNNTAAWKAVGVNTSIAGYADSLDSRIPWSKLESLNPPA